MRAVIDPVMLSQTAMRIWDQGRGNPLGWVVRTRLGDFESDDRVTWRTADGVYSAELRRSVNGQHVYLALFERGTYLGRYDVHGWRAASERSRVHQLRSRQLPPPPGSLNGDGRPAAAVRPS
jgi:hypothetical protein